MEEKNVDESWKEQAKADKEQADAAKAAPLPPADFHALVTSLATHALISLGALPDPQGKAAEPDLERAQYSIDLLDMLAVKTKGNLAAGEERHLTTILHELHLAFVAAAQKSGK
jgi:hypothetical protein